MKAVVSMLLVLCTGCTVIVGSDHVAVERQSELIEPSLFKK